ncbi:MAG: MBL fold metallo-hydrolase [Bacteroidetes bacterium]|nr:MBL fold metallo-hydrolase [Bacteroidota bacterium]
MKLSIVNTGLFKLDGGAMFGIVPKVLWKKLNPPDENNLCTWTMRCLLVETGDKKILIDTGMGNKQDAKFRSHFEPHGDDCLSNSLQELMIPVEEITDVFLTHLHFDHVGGAVKYDEKGKLVPVFPNATYWSNELQYNWAFDANPREKASFLKENFVPLKNQDCLEFIDVQSEIIDWMEGISLFFTYGHTEAMMIPLIKMNGKTIIYCADLMPSVNHIGLPYIMSYDIRPLASLEEKTKILEAAVDEKHILFFEHDSKNECATVKKSGRGRIVLDESFTLQEIIKQIS